MNNLDESYQDHPHLFFNSFQKSINCLLAAVSSICRWMGNQILVGSDTLDQPESQ